MLSGDVAGSSTIQRTDGHKRTSTSYARVAIPLPLSKPKVNGQEKIDPKTSQHGNTQRAQEQDTKAKDRPAIADIAKQDSVHGHNDTNSIPAETSAVCDSLPTSVTNGNSAQVSQNGSTQPSTPSQDQIEALKEPARIRTELPPAFVPSSGQPTPRTADSDRSSHRHSQNFPMNIGAKQMVFQADTSAAASPVPPYQNGPAFPLPYHGPQLPAQSPDFFPSRHSHHASETFANHAPPSNNHQQSYASNDPHHNREPYVEGHHRQMSSLSYASPAFQPFANVNNDRFLQNQGFPTESSGHRSLSFSNPNPFSGRALDDAMALRQHVSTFSATNAYSDIELQFRLERDGTSDVFHGHKIVLTRSSTLAQTLESASDKVDIALPGKWIDLPAFGEALRWLYGSDGGAKVPGRTIDAHLRYSIACIASGQYLNVSTIARRGVEMATTFLQWDTLPIALRFALDGGIHSAWYQRDVPSSVNGVNGIARTTITESSSTQLLHSVVNFMVMALPTDFYIDTSAPELPDLTRLPQASSSASTNGNLTDDRSVTHRASRSINDPRLSRIRFGNVGGPSSPFTTISSLLFSLPLPLIAHLLEHPVLSDRLGSATVASITRAVNVEREKRRQQALQQHRANSPKSSDAALLEGLHAEEVVETDNQSPSGLRLLRRHVEHTN